MAKGVQNKVEKRKSNYIASKSFKTKSILRSAVLDQGVPAIDPGPGQPAVAIETPHTHKHFLWI